MSVFVFLGVVILFLIKTHFIWWPVLKWMMARAEARNQRAEAEVRQRTEADARKREEDARHRRFHTYPFEKKDERRPRALPAPEDVEPTDS